jgi:hypothetical protein
MKILKISAVIALTSSSINADTLQNRADENWRTESILSGTPISVMSYGIKRLDEDLSDLASNEWYFKQFKQDGEIGLLQAFNSVKIIEDTVSPVILIRATIWKPGKRSNRSKASAEDLCQKLLDQTSQTVGIFVDDDNDYFFGLWSNPEFFADYLNLVDLDSIQSMIYLKARVGHSGSDDMLSCERYY